MKNCRRGIVLATILMVVIGFGFSGPGYAKVEVVNVAAIPQSAAAQAIKDSIQALEPLVSDWVPTWTYNVPKSEVSKELKRCYKMLDDLAVQAPDNPELFLFKGLVAHYAYQLDLKEYFDRATLAFKKAKQLKPTDYRPDWFLGVHLVKAGTFKEGMGLLLQVAKIEPYSSLPSGFWEDFAYCALLAGMPSHASLGLEYANRIEGKQSQMDLVLGPIVQKRLKQPAPNSYISETECWWADQEADAIRFTNRIFGLALLIPKDWKVVPGICNNGTTTCLIKPPIKNGLSGTVAPSILLVAKQQQTAGDLAELTNKILSNPKYTFKTVAAKTGWGNDQAYEGYAPTVYAPEKGAHNIMVVFSRNEPARSGLLLEKPLEIKSTDSKAGVSYYSPREVYTRYPGRIIYLVILDTTESIFTECRPEFEKILAGLVVE